MNEHLNEQMQGATDPLDSSGQPEALVPGTSHWLSHLNSPCLTFPSVKWDHGSCSSHSIWSVVLPRTLETKARGSPESFPSTAANEEAEARRKERPKEVPEVAPCPMPGRQAPACALSLTHSLAPTLHPEPWKA